MKYSKKLKKLQAKKKIIAVSKSRKGQSNAFTANKYVIEKANYHMKRLQISITFRYKEADSKLHFF